ncbi:hypothetical protein GCM10010520_46040 [Rhizobium viscosum]
MISSVILLSSLPCFFRSAGARDFNPWRRRRLHRRARNDLCRRRYVGSGSPAGKGSPALIVVQRLGLEQSKIKIKDNHILALAAREEPYKLQEFGDKTLLGHQNLHAYLERRASIWTH